MTEDQPCFDGYSVCFYVLERREGQLAERRVGPFFLSGEEFEGSFFLVSAVSLSSSEGQLAGVVRVGPFFLLHREFEGSSLFFLMPCGSSVHAARVLHLCAQCCCARVRIILALIAFLLFSYLPCTFHTFVLGSGNLQCKSSAFCTRVPAGTQEYSSLERDCFPCFWHGFPRVRRFPNFCIAFW